MSDNISITDVFHTVAKEISTRWKILAWELPISDEDINTIDAEERTLQEKARKALTVWSQKSKNVVTWDILNGKLRSIEAFDVIRAVEISIVQNDSCSKGTKYNI